MGPEDLKLLRDTYRLALENNKMLHKMRHRAVVSMIVWLFIYVALIAAPIWLYVTYFDGAVQTALKAYDSLQGGDSQAAEQYQGLRDAVRELQMRMGQMTSPSTEQR